MLTPVSWLKEYVNFSLNIKELGWRLTELGLGFETVRDINGDQVLELEITPNRPDLLSIIGVAREIAAIEQKKIKLPSFEIPVKRKNMPIKVTNDFKLFPRYTAIIIDRVKIKPSPDWLQNRLLLIGLRPINNVVDITNYVMYELGIPLHAFDYDKIKAAQINVEQAKGGESFTSVDNLTYKLPKGAIIIKDDAKIIDLCGIKGGLNSAISQNTQTVYLQVTADDPYLIRRASQALSLRSDASAIFERGVDKGGLTDSLKRAVNLMCQLTDGVVASDIIDLSQEKFQPWKVKLNLARCVKILGISIPEKTVFSILNNLSLSPEKSDKEIVCTVPTYRQDLKIEEDLIEEVARVYCYNKFPKTLPPFTVSLSKVAYHKEYKLDKKLKYLLKNYGYTEFYSYSLVSKSSLAKTNLAVKNALKISNPPSKDYEYLRPSLIMNLLAAIKFNEKKFDQINLFEMGRVYKGLPLKTEEAVKITLTRSDGNYLLQKGVIEDILRQLNINQYSFTALFDSQYSQKYDLFLPHNSAVIQIGHKFLGVLGLIKYQVADNFGLNRVPCIAELDFNLLEKLSSDQKYTPVPSFPPIIEDLAFTVKENVYVGDIINLILRISPLIADVTLLDKFATNRTFRLIYQHKLKSLKTSDIKTVREKIIHLLDKNFSAKIKAIEKK